VKINYFSDIQSEFGRLEVLGNDAEIIIAAGKSKELIVWNRSINRSVMLPAVMNIMGTKVD
jgi:hypothetical protein